MGIASKYWKLVKLESSGHCQICEMPSAQTFYHSAFPEFAKQTDVPDLDIQRKLIQWVREPETLVYPNLSSTDAQLCLLCFISGEIEQVCLNLEAKYGTEYGFTCHDLLPFVLDEPGTLEKTATPYQSFARQILQSFNPEQSSLATWTNRRVKFHPELNGFLLERGIYQVSNWAILNDTRPKQIERILSGFYQLTPLEVQQNQQLLASYHTVYRAQRLSQPKTGFKRRCQPPTLEQYQRMAEILERQWNQPPSAKIVAFQLQELATLLRDYRICARGGQVPTPTVNFTQSEQLEQIPAPDSDVDSPTETTEFLKAYRQQLISSLDAALALVLHKRLKPSKRQNSDKLEQFLKGLRLFHCQGESMGDIAQELGLKAQYQVTRLLKLKELRADVRQTLLIELRTHIREVAKNYTDSQRLQIFDQQIDQALEEQISQVIQEAESESHISQNRPTTSLFSKRLCRYIDTLFKSRSPS